jgi:hypothetical protein
MWHLLFVLNDARNEEAKSLGTIVKKLDGILNWKNGLIYCNTGLKIT